MPTVTSSIAGIILTITVPFGPIKTPITIPITDTSILYPYNHSMQVAKQSIINIESIRIMQANG